MRAFAIALLAAITAGSALADEKPVQLKNAPGLDKIEAHCGACHSLDYIIMNSPFLKPAGWESEVAKMINAFGAPIGPADAKIITEYLTTNYGDDGGVSARPPEAGRQPPNSRMTAKGMRADRRDLRRKSSVARKHAASRGAGQMNRRSAHVVRPSSRPGLLQRLKTRLARTPSRSTAGSYASSYECWQDEGYGRRTPCGAGAAGGGGGGGGGGDGGGMGN